VALTVEVFVVVVLDLAVVARGNAWGGALRDQRGAEPVAVITFVSQQFLGARERRERDCQDFRVWASG